MALECSAGRNIIIKNTQNGFVTEMRGCFQAVQQFIRRTGVNLN